MQGYLEGMDAGNSVRLEGWRMLNKDAHIGIEVKLEDLLPESVSIKEREEVKKDRSGKEISRRRLYWQEVVYTFSAFAEIKDHKGAHINNIVLADRGYKQVYKSPEFGLRQLAEGYFMINSLTITGQLYKNCVNRAITQLSERVTNDLGYATTTVTEHMWILDSKKHPEYQAHRKAFQTINEILFTISADRPLDGVKEQLQPAIDYFESIKKKYSSTNKHDRKLRYASYYNLAVLYYYLDDPQLMRKEATGLILNDFDAKDGRNLEASALRLKNLFLQTGLNSRHFAVDTSLFTGPKQLTPGMAVK
jgi:hypothetical protein